MIAELELQEAGILVPFYNRLVAAVPFCFPVTEEESTAGLVWQSADHSLHARLHEPHLLVCYRASEAIGIVHTAVESRFYFRIHNLD